MLILLYSFCFKAMAQEQTNIYVNSLAEMMEYMDDDNVYVTLATGTYDIGLDDADDDEGDDGLDLEPTFFWITGTNSTFDFQNSKINIDTKLFSHYVNYNKYNYGHTPSVDEFHITGTDITVKNLTVEDIGWSAPQRTATGWMIDGENVTLDNITHTVRGSYPYGFGDAFGKGGPYQTGLRPLKHGGIVIRGLNVTLKNCNVYQYSYGHAIQLIACQGVTIDGCYVEGEMKSTDDMYDGVGIAETEYNAAVAADFMTTWVGEFQLPRGYYMSLAEDGIRTYNTDGWWVGGSIRDGGYKTSDVDNDERRNTENIYVTNSEVRGMRTAFTLYQGGEDKVIDNCRAYDNEAGFVTARGRAITNCYGNAKYGPVFSVVYGEEGIDVDITIDDNEAVDGQYQMAYVSGWNHKVNLKSSVTPNPNQEITVGGRKYGPRNIEESEGGDVYLDNAYNGVYDNQSGYPMVLTPGAATYNTGTSNAAVAYNYVDNNNINVIIDETECTNTAELIEAECFDEMDGGVQSEDSDEGGQNIGYIEDQNWVKYNFIDLTEVYSVESRVASAGSGGTIEVRLDALDGELLTTIPVENTGGWQSWTTTNNNIGVVDGVHSVFFVFSGSTNEYLFNIDWFSFSEDVICDNSTNQIEAECHDEMSGIQSEGCSEGTKNIGWIEDGDWSRYNGIDFTELNSVNARVSSKSTEGIIEFRLDALDGELIASLPVSYTGGDQNWITESVNLSSVSGIHDVYTVFKGGDGYLYNINWFSFSEEAIETDILVDIKVFLEGAYIGNNLMENNLTSLIPMTEPYTQLGYTNQEGGVEIIDIEVMNQTGVNKVIDWLIIELRDPSDMTTVLYSRPALLLADGDVVDVDGQSSLSFINPPEQAYVVVKHRNHLGAMSKKALDLSSTNVLIDFTDLSNVYSDTSISNTPIKQMSNGEYALYQGDVNNDGEINSSDASAVFLQAVPLVNDTYDVYDVNMNSQLSTSDASKVFENAVPIKREHLK